LEIPAEKHIAILNNLEQTWDNVGYCDRNIFQIKSLDEEEKYESDLRQGFQIKWRNINNHDEAKKVLN
jgi:hypothetical protein